MPEQWKMYYFIQSQKFKYTSVFGTIDLKLYAFGQTFELWAKNIFTLRSIFNSIPKSKSNKFDKYGPWFHVLY